MKIDDYELDILIQGFPGKSVCHGGLGWSTIALLRGHGRVALIDTGSFGMRRPLIDRLAERGLRPADITDVLLTHSHYDHAVNWTLFRHARIVIGKVEMNWALDVPWGETPVAELYVGVLSTWKTVETAGDADEVLPRITAHLGPGHTPGCLIFKLNGSEIDVIFTGDAAKNRAELVSGTTDMTYDAKTSATTIAGIWEMWRERPGSIVVPGHDVPMVLEGDTTRYLATRKAAIKAWFGDDMETMTTFELVSN
jgi:glyoxylase-like metal-dependent hydrolase (beta-lactamase superfamily II)